MIDISKIAMVETGKLAARLWRVDGSLDVELLQLLVTVSRVVEQEFAHDFVADLVELAQDLSDRAASNITIARAILNELAVTAETEVDASEAGSSQNWPRLVHEGAPSSDAVLILDKGSSDPRLSEIGGWVRDNLDGVSLRDGILTIQGKCADPENAKLQTGGARFQGKLTAVGAWTRVSGAAPVPFPDLVPSLEQRRLLSSTLVAFALPSAAPSGEYRDAQSRLPEALHPLFAQLVSAFEAIARQLYGAYASPPHGLLAELILAGWRPTNVALHDFDSFAGTESVGAVVVFGEGASIKANQIRFPGNPPR